MLHIATCVSEKWTCKTYDESKSLVFEIECLRAILVVTVMNRFTNA